MGRLMREREAIRAWMRATMEAKDWSAEHWARLSKTSATNITRFVRDVNEYLPSTTTLMKLARVAGSSPDLASGAVKLAERRIRIEGGDGVVIPATGVSHRAGTHLVADSSLREIGVLAGDVVIWEPVDVIAPRAGALVIVQSLDANVVVLFHEDDPTPFGVVVEMRRVY